VVDIQEVGRTRPTSPQKLQNSLGKDPKAKKKFDSLKTLILISRENIQNK
jgi:hypothetical protein